MTSKNMSLKWNPDESTFTANLDLPGVRGLRSAAGPYGALGGVSPGHPIAVSLLGEWDLTTKPAPEGLLAHASAELARFDQVLQCALEAVFQRYPDWQDQYGYDDEERQAYMPTVGSPAELRRLIGLHQVHIHALELNSIPYIGLEFGCSWDPEHGLGILMHGTRVVRVGGADTSILVWMAEDDSRTRLKGTP